MIWIKEDGQDVGLTEGCVLYTEDGREFTQVDTATNHILSITQPGTLLEAFLSLATWGPVPGGARFENVRRITIG